MNISTLGEPRSAFTLSYTVSDEIRIPEHIRVGSGPGFLFELAGPRSKQHETSRFGQRMVAFRSRGDRPADPFT
jgi:hypothetical protein